MSTTNHPTYQGTILLQSFLYIPMMLCYALGFLAPACFVFAALLQFLVGIVQVFTGIYHSINSEEPFFKQYLKYALGYLAALFPLCALGAEFFEASIILFLFIIPVAIASWHFWMLTKLNKQEEPTILPTPYQEDLLDDIML